MINELSILCDVIKLLESCIKKTTRGLDLNRPDISDAYRLTEEIRKFYYALEVLDYKINGMREYIHEYRKSQGDDI